MFANNQMNVMNMAFPDVCQVPTPAGPVPTPFPNLSTSAMGVGAAPNVLFGGAPAHNLATVVPLSNGDNAGVAGGVASGTVMGPTTHLTGAFTVLVGGTPATRMTSATLQNTTNSAGLSLTPGQTKVLLLAG